MGSYIVGIDIGGTHIRIGSSSAPGSLEHFEKVLRITLLGNDHPVKKLADFIRQYGDRHAAGKLPGLAVIGFPATLDAKRRHVLQAPNIPGLDGLSAQELEEQLGIPVIFEKDVNLLFYCDMEDLHLSPQGLAAGIYIGTGIGNALFHDGSPLPGKNGVSGELGHIPKSGSNSVCGCGNRGCSECFGSGRRLVEIQKEFFSGTDISQLFKREWPHEQLQQFVDEIACIVATEINILDPDSLVLGGGVINMDGFPRATLEERILSHVRKPYPAQSLKIHYSVDGLENGVRGALSLGWKAYCRQEV